MPKLLTMLLASALLIPLAGCGTINTSAPSSPCVSQAPGQLPAWRGISWSKRDTPETIDEIKAHNARFEAWCNPDGL